MVIFSRSLGEYKIYNQTFGPPHKVHLQHGLCHSTNIPINFEKVCVSWTGPLSPMDSRVGLVFSLKFGYVGNTWVGRCKAHLLSLFRLAIVVLN